jgi:hypothetical protein
MIVIRLISYFLILFLFTSLLSVSSVAWSFIESVKSSYNLITYTSDNKARDILATVAKVAEHKMNPDGYTELNEIFFRLIKQSEQDLDKFIIKEIFLISNKGNLLSHSNEDELNLDTKQKYDKPYFSRALRMRKGQLPSPQVYGTEEYKGDNSFFSNQILKLFPDLKYQETLLSAPIYMLENLDTIGSIHLIYSRGNVLNFIETQRKLFFWMLFNYIGISFVVSIFLFGIYAIFLFGTYKQAVRRIAKQPEPEHSEMMTKVLDYVSKHEARITEYLTPLQVSNVGNISEIIENSLHPENITSSNFEKIDLNITKTDLPIVETKKKDTEIVDAIYLD